MLVVGERWKQQTVTLSKYSRPDLPERHEPGRKMNVQPQMGWPLPGVTPKMPSLSLEGSLYIID